MTILYKMYEHLIEKLIQNYDSWDSILMSFFDSIQDDHMATMKVLAGTFNNSKYPNYLRIVVSRIQRYFDIFQISHDSLLREGFSDGSEFILDNDGLRISFITFRR